MVDFGLQGFETPNYSKCDYIFCVFPLKLQVPFFPDLLGLLVETIVDNSGEELSG